MCQPCGRVLGLPSRFGFYLNSSPIVCVANALGIILKILWRSISEQSVNAAAELTANEIFEDVESPGHHDALIERQNMRRVRYIVFLLGALSQIIKLYGLTGIPVTKLCASGFLGSFCIIEIVMLWLKYCRPSSSSQRPSNRSSFFDDLLRTPAFFTTLALSTHALMGAAFQPLAVPKVSYAFLLIYWTITGFYIGSLLRISFFYSSSVYYTLSAVLVYAARRGSAASEDLDTPASKDQYWKMELGKEKISQASIQCFFVILLRSMVVFSWKVQQLFD